MVYLTMVLTHPIFILTQRGYVCFLSVLKALRGVLIPKSPPPFATLVGRNSEGIKYNSINGSAVNQVGLLAKCIELTSRQNTFLSYCLEKVVAKEIIAPTPGVVE